MMLSKFKALPPKWAIDERIKLARIEQDLYLMKRSADLIKIAHEKAKLEKRIREILIHGHINQRARIQEQGY